MRNQTKPLQIVGSYFTIEIKYHNWDYLQSTVKVDQTTTASGSMG